MIEFDYEQQKNVPAANIKVIGVGGAGGNTVNSMIEAQFEGVEFIVANTDAQALNISHAHHKIQLGLKSTKGLGTGSNPELGKRAAEEDIDKVMEFVEDADIVFLAGGMGGGTGSGGLPVIAQALKEKGILSIAVVTKPFLFEGKKRASVAEKAIEFLKQDVDTLLIMPNQKLLEVVDTNVSMIDAFAMINGVLTQSVKGIADIITKPGHINVDFADVRAIMKGMGLAVMGTGTARGENRAREAAIQAITSPLLENMSIEGARGVLLNISGGTNLGLHELSEAASIIYDKADEDATIILGSVIDEALSDEVIVTVIATGFYYNQQEDSVQNAVHVSSPVVSIEVEQKKVESQEIKSHAQEQSEEIKKEEVSIQEARTEDQDLEEEKHVLIDTNDLDIPTFLRKYEMEKRENSNS